MASQVRYTRSASAGDIATTNWRSLMLYRGHPTVCSAKPGMPIALGGIAKGHAVDRSIELLKARDIEHASVSAGGNSRIQGDRLGRIWFDGIRHPDDANRVMLRNLLEDVVLSTSGDSEGYFDENSAQYHHIINPRAGHSAGKVCSTTIIGPDVAPLRRDGGRRSARGADRASPDIDEALARRAAGVVGLHNHGFLAACDRTGPASPTAEKRYTRGP